MTLSDPHGPATDDAAGVADAVSALGSTLWRERELLDQLLFALTSEQLLLAAGALRWLTAADAQVRAAVAALTDVELERAIDAAGLALALGLSPDAGLTDLAAAAPAPWDVVLTEHRDALRTASGEIAATATEVRRLLQAGSALVRDTLDTLAGMTGGGTGSGPATVTGYADLAAAAGRPRPRVAGPLLVDRQA